MQMLNWFSVYDPNGAHTSKPAAAYIPRAGSNGCVDPVSRLTRS
jgi:hypothetical protein